MKLALRTFLARSACALVVSSLLSCGGKADAPALSGSDPVDGGVASPADGTTDAGLAASSGGEGDAEATTGAAGALSIFAEPSDKAAALLQAMSQAKTSIHMTMYLLGDKRFVNALIAQKKAMKDVKVLLNKSFPTGGGTGNQPTFDALSAAGVSVEWAPASFALTHEKCVIIDGSEAWIMTMNLEASSSQNREFLAVDRQPADVSEAEAVFDADWSGTTFTPSGDLVVAPVNARSKLLALIESAKVSVDLEGEELSDEGVVGALLAAQARGLPVRVVLANSTTSPAQNSAVQTLKSGKVTVASLDKPYVHAKAIVVDGSVAYVGSENFTTNSLDKNRELGLITSDTAAVKVLRTTIAGDITAATAL